MLPAARWLKACVRERESRAIRDNGTVEEREGPEMVDRKIELSVEPLPGDAWIRVVRAGPADYCRLSGLSTGPRAWNLRLQDSAGVITWQPDGVERPGAGRLFAEVLKQLYDGRRWRMNLPLSHSTLAFRDMSPGRDDDDYDRWRDGLLRPLSRHKVRPAFRLADPNPDDPDDPHFMEYFWCPIRALGHVLADSWSLPTGGCVARLRDRGALEACYAAGDPARILERLLATCRLAFQWAGEGAAMIILSHQLTRDEIEDATHSRHVQHALRALNEKAPLVTWTARR